jgi:hypothetical protein
MERMTALEFVAALHDGRRDFSEVYVTGTVKNSELPNTNETIKVGNIESLEGDVPIPCRLSFTGM